MKPTENDRGGNDDDASPLTSQSSGDHALHEEDKLVPDVASQLRNGLQSVWGLSSSSALDVRPNHEPPNECAQPPRKRKIVAEVWERHCGREPRHCLPRCSEVLAEQTCLGQRRRTVELTSAPRVPANVTTRDEVSLLNGSCREVIE